MYVIMKAINIPSSVGVANLLDIIILPYLCLRMRRFYKQSKCFSLELRMWREKLGMVLLQLCLLMRSFYKQSKYFSLKLFLRY
jgi:hypothetical protein